MHIDLGPAANSGHYRGQCVDRRWNGVELARPVVGHEDPRNAGLDGLETDIVALKHNSRILRYCWNV